MALRDGGPREVPVGTQLQVSATGPGQIWTNLGETQGGISPADHCRALRSWSRYESSLRLTQPTPNSTLCVYVTEHGYLDSAVAHAQLQVRPWTQPVQILQQPAAPSNAELPELTVTIAGQDGAAIWYTLEAHNDSTLCEAKVHAFHLAPNLTLAADAAWRQAAAEVRP